MNHKNTVTITLFLLFATSPLCADDAKGGDKKASGTPLLAGYLSPVPVTVLADLSVKEITPPSVSGIELSYCGYKQYTNADGYFQFPKKHAANDVRVIICTNTDFDRIKNTVSQIKVKTAMPSIAVYRITKQKDTALQPKTPSGDSTADAKKDASKDKKPDTSSAAGSDTQETAPDVWSMTVHFEGTAVPTDGVSPQDLIIYANPNDLYIEATGVAAPPKDDTTATLSDAAPDATFFTTESPHFIIPPKCMYVLRSNPSCNEHLLDLDTDDQFMESVDTAMEEDEVASKSSDTDSMGNPLPGIKRSAIPADD